MRDPSLLIGGRSRNEARGLTSPRSKLGEHITTLDFTKLPLGGVTQMTSLIAVQTGSVSVQLNEGRVPFVTHYDRSLSVLATSGNQAIAYIALPSWDWTEMQVECAMNLGSGASVQMRSGFVHGEAGAPLNSPIAGYAAYNSQNVNSDTSWYRRLGVASDNGNPDGFNYSEFPRVVTARLRRYPGGKADANPVGRNPRDALNRPVRPALVVNASTSSSGTVLGIFKIHLFRRERESQ